MSSSKAKMPPNNDNDQDDKSSNGSPRSMRSCNVVLKRADLSQFENENIAHNTRRRKSSNLTTDNVAALPSTETKRPSRAKSIASDETASTSTTATRRTSSRLAAAPKTPKKDAAPEKPKKEVATKTPKAEVATRTPSRRNSRLISDTEAPISSPAKRTLRASSVLSDVTASPRTRSTRTRSIQKSPEPSPAVEPEVGTPGRRRAAATRKTTRTSRSTDDNDGHADSNDKSTAIVASSSTKRKSLYVEPIQEEEDNEKAEPDDTSNKDEGSVQVVEKMAKTPVKEVKVSQASIEVVGEKVARTPVKEVKVSQAPTEEMEAMDVDDSDASIISIESSLHGDASNIGSVSKPPELPSVIEDVDECMTETNQEDMEPAVLIRVDTQSTLSASNDICDLTHDSDYEDHFEKATSMDAASDDVDNLVIDEDAPETEFTMEIGRADDSAVSVGSSLTYSVPANDKQSPKKHNTPRKNAKSLDGTTVDSPARSSKGKIMDLDSEIENIASGLTPKKNEKKLSTQFTQVYNSLNTPDRYSGEEASPGLRTKIDQIISGLNTPVSSIGRSKKQAAIDDESSGMQTPKRGPGKTPANTPVMKSAINSKKNTPAKSQPNTPAKLLDSQQSTLQKPTGVDTDESLDTLPATTVDQAMASDNIEPMDLSNDEEDEEEEEEEEEGKMEKDKENVEAVNSLMQKKRESINMHTPKMVMKNAPVNHIGTPYPDDLTIEKAKAAAMAALGTPVRGSGKTPKNTPAKSPAKPQESATPAKSAAESKETVVTKTPAKSPKTAKPVKTPSKPVDSEVAEESAKSPKIATPSKSPAKPEESAAAKTPAKSPKSTASAESPAKPEGSAVVEVPAESPENATVDNTPAKAEESALAKTPAKSPKSVKPVKTPSKPEESALAKTPAKSPKTTKPEETPSEPEESAVTKTPAKSPKSAKPPKTPSKPDDMEVAEEPAMSTKIATPSKSPAKPEDTKPAKSPKNATPAKSSATEIPSKSPKAKTALKTVDHAEAIDQSMAIEEDENCKAVNVSTSSRKSVRIETPKSDAKNSSFTRIGTPYPSDETIEQAEASTSKKVDVSQHAKAVNKLKDAFNDLAQTRPAFQAAINESKAKLEEIKSKPIVVARNNWDNAKRLVDSESSDDDDDDVLMVDNEDVVESDDEEGDETNEFVDDQAESVGDDYESGDSMDEEEREERRLNEIHDDGESVGSETSEDELDENEEDDDGAGSLDSFIVDDAADETADSDSSDSINIASKNVKKRSAKRFSRIMVAETDSDDDEEETAAVHVTDNVDVNKQNDVQEMDVDEDIEMAECDEPEQKTEQIDEGKKAEKAKKSKKSEKIPKTEEAEKAVDTEVAAEEVVKTVKAKKSAEIEIVKDAKTTQENNQAAKEIEVAEQDLVTPIQATDAIRMEPDSTGSENTMDDHASKPNESNRTRLSLPGIRPIVMPVQRTSTRKSYGDASENSGPVSVVDIPQLSADAGNDAVKVKAEPIELEPIETEPIEIEDQEDTDMDTSNPVTKKSRGSKAKDVSSTANEENNNDKQSTSRRRPKERPIKVETEDSEEEQVKTTSGAIPKRGLKKKVRRAKEFEESDVEPAPHRLLNVVKTTSGMFIEEPVTPVKKNRFGFKVDPMTPVRKDFMVMQMHIKKNGGKAAKRKSLFIDVEEPSLTLPKPKWTNDVVQQCGSAKRRRVCTESVDSILQPLNKPRQLKSSKQLLPRELIEFRQKNLYRKGIPRLDSDDLIRQQKRRRF